MFTSQKFFAANKDAQTLYDISKGARWFGYFCTLVLVIIEALVAVSLFQITQGSFETIVIGLLVILYLMVRSIGLGLSLTFDRQSLLLINELSKIKEKLEIYEPEDDDVAQAIVKAKTAQTKGMIVGIAYFIIFVGVLLTIFGAIQ